MRLSMRGLEGLKKQLRTIDQQVRPKLLRSAMRSAFKPVLDAARAKVPVDSGELHAALGVAYAKGRTDTQGAVGIVVGKGSARAKQQAAVAAAAFGEKVKSAKLPPARRWHLTELGTAHSAPQPFLRPALDENAQRVVDGLGKGVEKRIKKLAKKRGGR